MFLHVRVHLMALPLLLRVVAITAATTLIAVVFCFAAPPQSFGHTRRWLSLAVGKHGIPYSSIADAVDGPAMSGDILSVANWLLKEGGEIHSCVKVSLCGSGGGRCVMTRCSIQEGELIVSVPAEAQLRPWKNKVETETSSTSGTSSWTVPCPALQSWLALSSKEGGAAEWHLDYTAMQLVLRLLEERHQGSESRYAEYLATVPKSYPSIMWDKNVQDLCIKGTPGELHIERRFQRKWAELNLLNRCIGMLGLNVSSKGEAVNDDILHWAVYSVGSRSYEVRPPTQGSPPLNSGGHGAIMAPFADLFNDSPEWNAKWQQNAETDALEIVAKTTIPEGTEISISYGGKTNEKLLTRYGFVHQNNAREVGYVDVLPSAELSASPASLNSRLALSGDGSVTAAGLPLTLTYARKSIQQRQLGNQSASRMGAAELELASLILVRDQCAEAAKSWAPKPGGTDSDEACTGYRRGLESLGRSCVEFADRAIRAVKQLSNNTGSDLQVLSGKRSKLHVSMYKAWLQDAAVRLPGLLQQTLRKLADPKHRK